MNIEKLVRMSREKIPNQQLAKLSTQWAEQKKLGNPVRNAVTLWHWRWFTRISITLFIVWLTITLVWEPHTPSIPSDGPRLWTWIGVALVALPISILFILLNEHYENDAIAPGKRNQDAKHFVRAVTILEGVLGKPLLLWEGGMNEGYLEIKTEDHLKQLASAVKFAEKIEKEEIERAPWKTPNAKEQASLKRDVFDSNFELLTSVLPLPKDKGYYYGNKGSASTEGSATS